MHPAFQMRVCIEETATVKKYIYVKLVRWTAFLEAVLPSFGE